MTTATTNPVPQPKNMGELARLLTRYDIPVEKYGIGLSLPLQALLEQLEDGTLILEERAGKLVRSVWVAAVNVYYVKNGKTLKLDEDRQVYIDYESKEPIHWRKVRRKTEWSVGQKFPKNGDPLSTAVFALSNELGLDIAPERLENMVRRVNFKNGGRYPGMKSHIRIYEYDLYLTRKEFKEQGYEHQDKYLRSYFYWKGEA